MKKILKAFALLLMVFLIWVTYGIVRSYGWPVVNTYEISSDRIREEKRICVIGDLHSKHFDTLVSQISEQKPDLILMAGDIFDQTDKELDPTMKTVRELTGVAPVFFAMGNHELKLAAADSEFMRKLEETGVRIIEKTYYDLSDDLRIGGMYDYPFGWNQGGWNTADSAPEEVCSFMNDFMDTERFTLFAAHRPDSFYYSDASEEYAIDLVVSAHIHGGQVVLPVFGALYGGEQGWWPEYTHGYYQKNRIGWFLTSGLSTSRKALPRFNNPPEIAVIELKHR